jgi:hypothetical protein
MEAKAKIGTQETKTIQNPVLFRKLRSGNYARCYSVDEATEVLFTRQDFYNLVDRAAREGKKVIKATYRMSQTYYSRYDNLQLAAERMGL